MIEFRSHLSELAKRGNLRTIPDYPDAGKGYIDFSTNDYLGLSLLWKDYLPEFLKEFPDAGFSSSASRLLSTKQREYRLLEDKLGELYGKSALLFNSGYHANVGVVGALGTLRSTRFLIDKLVHASIYDGLSMCGAKFKRFSHNDMKALKTLLKKEIESEDFPPEGNIVVIVESVYSMEGDTAPLRELTEIKKEFNSANPLRQMILYVDEAHAFGVFGDKGLGLSEATSTIADIDFIIGTFGKAGASAGAFAVCNEEARSFLLNFARPFIFSTALPPVNIAWSNFMLQKIVTMQAEREALALFSEKFRRMVEEITGSPNPSRSQIVPFVTGDSISALKLSEILRNDYSIIAHAIRRPTVPPGKECLRFSLKYFPAKYSTPKNSPGLADNIEGFFDYLFPILKTSWDKVNVSR